MAISTVAGIVAGVVAIAVSILWDNGRLLDFLNIPSVMIVFGGTIASTLVTFPMSELKKLPTLLKYAMNRDKVDVQEDIDQIISMANVARKDGLLALENMLDQMDNTFMKNGVMLILDGIDPEMIKTVLENEVYFMDERHSEGKKIFEAMASYAPAYGMIGTLVGLINMLVNLNDADKLGPSMAVALVTTFYGVILANLIFTPLANQLAFKSKREQLQKEIIIEGILSIQDGENPRVIRDKLAAFVSNQEAEKIEVKSPQKREELADD